MKNKFIIIFKIFITILLILSINIISAIKINTRDNMVSDIYNIKPSSIDMIFDKDNYEILYPLSTVPALVEKNSVLNIKFKAAEFEDVFVFISTAYEPVVDEFWLQIEDIWGDNSIWNIKVSISLDITEELYNVSLLFLNDNKFYTTNQPRALNIYDEFSDDFSFVHITDFHYGDPRGFAENISETIGFKSIKKCIKEINLLHPDFVIISGDVVFGQLYFLEYHYEYKKCYDLIQTFDVPTFLAPGNHDGYRRIGEDGLDFWQHYFGPLYYSFDFGDFHFISVNSYDMSEFLRLSILFIALNWGGSISDVQLNWIEDDLESSNSKLDFMFMHHNPIWDTKTDSLMLKEYENREELLSLIYENGVDMVLAGHNHLDTVNIENNVIFLTTTTPESEIKNEDGYWGYRLIEIRDGEIYSYNYKEPKYSIPSYKLDYDIWKSERIAIVTIKNELEIDVDIVLKLLMYKGFYSINNGEIFLQRDNDKYSELYIHSNIQALSNENIIVFRI
jgi:3',5'-cyclic AMP phosphodiesterase CpdA